MKKRRSATEIRSEQITRQLEKSHYDVATKTRRDYKSERGFEQATNTRLRTRERLESELSALTDPSDYNELPIAVVADELA
jgi:predicted nucleotidyltransferase